MTRSRLLLLVAWGLLALGSIVQVVRPDGDGNEAADTGPDRLAFDADDGDETGQPDDGSAGDETVIGSDPSDTADGENDRDGSDPSEAATTTEVDPLTAVSAVLPPQSFVATATGAGVASKPTPESDAADHWFPNPTQFGGERAFLVVDQDSDPDYIKVSLPVMPNGQEGWIPREAVTIEPVQHRAIIDLSDHSVTVFEGDTIIVDTKAVTGKPTTPTPVGTFYVRDIIAQPDVTGSFGPYILALSGFSEVLDSFDGALPALAIHGTNKPDQIGTERSSGCVRIPNELITLLADTVPLGTPVAVVT